MRQNGYKKMELSLVKMYNLSVKMRLIQKTVRLMSLKGPSGQRPLAEALQKRHELEAQEEKNRLEGVKLRKLKEQMHLEAQISAAAAKVLVLEGSVIGEKAHSNAMNSYISKGLHKGKAIHLTPRHKSLYQRLMPCF